MKKLVGFYIEGSEGISEIQSQKFQIISQDPSIKAGVLIKSREMAIIRSSIPQMHLDCIYIRGTNKASDLSIGRYGYSIGNIRCILNRIDTVNGSMVFGRG